MITLQVSVEAGASIDTTAEEAQRLADQVACVVEFVFNGVTCRAAPGGDASTLAERQQVEQARRPLGVGDSFKFASSR